MMKIRDAGPQDRELLRKIRNDCRHFFVDTKLISRKKQCQFWSEKVETGSYRIWVVEDDHFNVFGYVQARNFGDNGCEIGIALLPRFRKMGYAREALTYAINHLRGIGLGKVWLEVREDNSRARKLFTEAGFTEAGRGFGPLLRMEMYL